MLSATSLQAKRFATVSRRCRECKSNRHRQNSDAPGRRVNVHIGIMFLPLDLLALKRSVRFLLALSLAVLFLTHGRRCHFKAECTVSAVSDRPDEVTPEVTHAAG